MRLATFGDGDVFLSSDFLPTREPPQVGVSTPLTSYASAPAHPSERSSFEASHEVSPTPFEHAFIKASRSANSVASCS